MTINLLGNIEKKMKTKLHRIYITITINWQTDRRYWFLIMFQRSKNQNSKESWFGRQNKILRNIRFNGEKSILNLLMENLNIKPYDDWAPSTVGRAQGSVSPRFWVRTWPFQQRIVHALLLLLAVWNEAKNF